MDSFITYFVSVVIIGGSATLVMDAWGWLRQPLLGVAPPNYGLVGRWLLHMRRGRFRHPAIGKAAVMRGEQLAGWLFHYFTGMVFAGLLVLVTGPQWLESPTLGPALLTGIVTVAAPFLLMQPGMGAGIAAAKTPAPNKARLQSLLTHGIFGAGLYVGGWVARLII
ncbi:DUF2938 domain-containing protein [Alcanivorax sp. DP30]|uniref:DUF2938 domain-containing protein n=1 Tax=Alcanivorax sp. DP30 TaxID=2606217 RepID=UPI00192712C0|nr:DUF2938 domain-containing protein [Alcanivorax sp. DP30]